MQIVEIPIAFVVLEKADILDTNFIQAARGNLRFLFFNRLF